MVFVNGQERVVADAIIVDIVDSKDSGLYIAETVAVAFHRENRASDISGAVANVIQAALIVDVNRWRIEAFG
jgi:hypothetical protein